MTNVCIYYKGVTGQKGENFSASFNAECLAVSEKMTTLHTHTHKSVCSLSAKGSQEFPLLLFSCLFEKATKREIIMIFQPTKYE